MAEIFKLPTSSYEELLKLIQAYADVKEGVALTLDQITQATGVPRTIVSKNNGFLVQTGLITEGAKKAATETGRALGRAYSSKISYEVERIWKEITLEVDFLNRMISAVRIRNGMDRSNFINHIVYSSGLKDSKEAHTGAGAIIEILKSVNILSEEDGKILVVEDSAVNVNTEPSEQQQENSDQGNDLFTIERGSLASSRISINININCSPSDIESLGGKIKMLIEQLSE